MCPTFFSAVFGISKKKKQAVVRVLASRDATVPATRVCESRPPVKYMQCKAFWASFFKFCQRPNDHTRLFPVNQSYPCIYDDFFKDWFAKTYPNSELPCISYFKDARHDDMFSDVKNRARHNHCRCPTCASLQARRLKVFNSTYDREQFKKEWTDHQNERRWWRDLEHRLVARARHSPATHNCFWFDDTNAAGFPHITNRPYKNLPTSRFQLIPFLIADLARGRDFYVYTAKGRFKKGANRLCTTLLRTLRATKFSGDASRLARKLHLIADNFAENKNNTLFAFCSDLVLRAWYDVIVLVYGPVGHTHNGGDQQHEIHNTKLFNFFLPTFVHMLARYHQAWRSEHSRPTPVLLDVQFDFDAYYKPYLRPVAGYTNTTDDPCAARAFKFERSNGGVVTMMWKTRAESGDWRGADGQVGTAGFEVLRGRPRGAPGAVEPTPKVMKKKYYNQLLGTKMVSCLEDEGCPEAVAWLKEAALHGVIPVDRRLQQVGELPAGALGSLVQLRCGDCTAEVQVIEDMEEPANDFWALPDDC